MNKMQQQVLDFHKEFGSTIGTTPGIRDAELRIALIKEEVEETFEAIKEGDLVEAIDGLCDILYVIFGTAITFGVNLEPFFDEVHRSNMDKLGGGVREDGKILKPVGWQGPRIEEILKQQRQKLW